MHGTQIFLELTAVFTVAVVLAWVLAIVRIPPVLAYLLAGAILGPRAFGLVDWDEGVHLLAEGGVALLLFTVGLEFPLGRLRHAWRPILAAGGTQIGLCVVLGGALALAWGRSPSEALVLGFVLALSSTAVVLAMLEERSETGTLLGQLLVGLLVMQDLAVVPMMLVVGSLAGPGSTVLGVGLTLGKALAIVVVVLVAGRWLVPRLLRGVARTRSREVFLLSVLAVGGAVAVATSATGLSLALGAFLAGITLAETDFVHQILGDLRPLRTAVACLFFVSMGMLFDGRLMLDSPGPVIALIAVVLVAKLLAGTAGLMAAGLPLGNAIHGGVAQAQIGEFSFVLAGVAAASGLITPGDLAIFTAASVVTMILTPLLVHLVPRSRATWGAWRRVERRAHMEGSPDDEPTGQVRQVLVAGFGHGGRVLVEALAERGIPSTVIETNPDTVVRERRQGRRVIYGDASNPDVLLHAGLADALALVVVISDYDAAHRIVSVASQVNPLVPVVLRTRWARDELAESHPSGVFVVSEEDVGASEIVRVALERLAPSMSPPSADQRVDATSSPM
ncbi:MAG: cation:proton antiporter [Pseudomonadota bacterium]